ncbi:hypothetical protein ASD15_24175 [Massilia sp. Root351]|nr:hypothetical protein ASD15_24175 [Massilia sp. Root351]
MPRIGSEVLVAFLGGDPDKPVIVGQLYNQHGLPPALSTVDGLPGSKYLSGIKSREIKGGRSNQLRLDDTTGEISAQLASDHGRSELNLGYLTQPRADGHGEPRGEGAELRSGRAVAVRGENGILISAAACGMGQQLDRAELLGVLDILNSISGQLASLAQTHCSDGAAGEQLAGLNEKLKSWSVAAGNRSVIAASAPDGMALISNENIVVGAQTKLDLVCQGEAQIASGQSIFARAAQGLSFFAHKLGIKLIAASGNVLVQSHQGDISLIATGRIKIAAGEGVEIQAPEVRIATKGAQADFGGGAITEQCSGSHVIKSATFAHTKGGDGSIDELKFPSTKLETDERIVLHHSQTGEPVVGRRYTLTLPDGSSIEGVTDEHGRTELANSDELGDIEVVIHPEDKEGD